MKNNYNIAFIPSSPANAVIEWSKKFSAIANGYLLGDESLPHVTLCKFSAEENEVSLILEKLAASDVLKSIELVFADFGCISFDEVTYWVSLMPDKVGELNQMHRMVADIIGQPSNSSFDPHMTLINTKDINYKQLVEDVKKGYSPIKDTFVLSLGIGDELGRYIKVVHSFIILG